MDTKGNHIYFQIDAEEEFVDNVYDLGEDFVFTIIKNLFLYDKDKYVSDLNGVSYGADLQNDMLNVDSYYMENYYDVIELRKKLLNEYHIDFELKN